MDSLFGSSPERWEEKLLQKKKRQGRGSNLKAAIKPYYWDPGFVLNRGKLAMQIFLVTNYP